MSVGRSVGRPEKSLVMFTMMVLVQGLSFGCRHPCSSAHGVLALRAVSVRLMAADMDEQERRRALRLPDTLPSEMLDDSGDPLGSGGSEMFDQAQFRVKRRAEAGEYDQEAASRSLPLVALLAQVGLGTALCFGFGFCYTVRFLAEQDNAWAVDALANCDAWYPAPARLVFDKPPGGPLTLLYAAANGLNALRCLPLLFDRLVVSRLPNDPSKR